MGGVVVRCQHAKAHIHDVGIRFDQALPAGFLSLDEQPENSAYELYAALGMLAEKLQRLIQGNAPTPDIAAVAREVINACEKRAPTEGSEADPAPADAAPGTPQAPASPDRAAA